MTIDTLVEGYRRFRAEGYEYERERAERLAVEGQAPMTMVISCCDSRVDPARIFSADLGELFVVRNVANLVPPCEERGDFHGTSAALEFAVRGLRVSQILILGHARCGGIQAWLEAAEDPAAGGLFIGPWMSILANCRDRVLADQGQDSQETRQRALEQAAILNSIENLHSFPFVSEALQSGQLALHGAYYDIAKGELWLFDPARKAFVLVE